MKKVIINGQTYEADDDFPQDLIDEQNKIFDERREACELARPAMERLAEVLRGRSGQPYKLRGILYSLWNGKPFSLVEIVGLDWEIRKDLSQVLLAFGSEDFFYDELKAAVTKVGQWPWFEEEYDNIKPLKEFLKGRAHAGS